MAHVCGGQVKDTDELMSTELKGLQTDRITDRMKNIKRMIPELGDSPSSSHVLNRNGRFENLRWFHPASTKCVTWCPIVRKACHRRWNTSKLHVWWALNETSATKRNNFKDLHSCFHSELICSDRGSQGPPCPLKFLFDWDINCVSKWHCVSNDR